MIGCVQPAHIGTVVTVREEGEQNIEDTCTQALYMPESYKRRCILYIYGGTNKREGALPIPSPPHATLGVDQGYLHSQ